MIKASLSKNWQGLEGELKRQQKFKAKGVEIGLKRAGLHLLRKSMLIVPVDTAALKNSGPNVTRAEGSGFKTKMIVGYGQDYAIYVHEDLNARHAPGKEAKFLEKPLRQERKTMQELVRKAAKS